jgi:hypothetical protein
MMAKRKKATAAPKTRKAKAKRAARPKAKRPDGSISTGIYDTVQKLTADGKMTRAAAFKQIAKEAGRNPNTVAVNYYYVAKKRGGTKRAATKRGRAKALTSTAAAAPKKAGISATIYDAIENLVAGGKMTRAAAFRQHAKATGRKEGTVAVNYYYAAKRRGTAKRRPGRPKGVVASRNGTGARIDSVLRSITDLVRAQAAELDALRKENARFAEIRKLVGRI